MFEQGINKARLGRMLERNGSTVKGIIYRSSMQCYILWELSIALNHNFFADLARQLDVATEGRLDSEQTELQQLKAEYQRIKEERDYLRKALDLISK
jgi:hypothetical protein